MRNTNQRRRNSRQQNQQEDQDRDSRGRFTNENQSYGNPRSQSEEQYDELRGEDQNHQYESDESGSSGIQAGFFARNSGYANQDQYSRGGQYGNRYGHNEGFQDGNRGRSWGTGGDWNQEERGSYGQREQSGFNGNQNSQSGRNGGSSFSDGSTFGEHKGKGPKGYQRSDERIHEHINDELSDNGEVDASEIEVKVEQGEVILTGTVTNRETKRKAEDIVEAVSGVKNVENRIRVTGESQSQSQTQRGESSGRSGRTEGSTKERAKAQ